MVDGDLRFQLMGGLGAWRIDPDGAATPLDLGGPQPRRLLAALLLSLGRPLSPDRLIELVWGEAPPASARGSLQAYISNLRRVLEPTRGPGQAPQVLVLRTGGYQLEVDASQVDTDAFECGVARGSAALAAGRPEAAIAPLAAALASAGPILPELGDVPFVRGAADRIEARRQTAFELLQTARVDAGALHDAIADLRGAVTADPRAERLWRLLALARYRSGDAAAAVATVHDARRALADATGLDLGPELRRLEADLLTQSPDLDRPPAPVRRPADGTAAPAPVHRPGSGRSGSGDRPRSCRRPAQRSFGQRTRHHHRQP